MDQGGMKIFFCGLPASPLSRPLSPPTRDVLNLAIRSFTAESEMQIMERRESSGRAVRDWGGWMDVLPSLTSGSDNDVLDPAIMALAASITTHRIGVRPTKASYLDAYGMALAKLRVAIQNIHSGSRFMILATIICLYTAALMLPIEENTLSRQAHHKGVQQLFQAIGPQGFIAMDHHKLFAGFRGSIIFEAIYMRKSSFTSHKDWKTLPFRLQKQNIIQKFLTIAADIPPLLEKFDALDGLSASQRDLSSLALSTDFRTIVDLVKSSFTLQTTAPFHRQVLPLEPGSSFHFRDFQTANIYINHWLFCAICYIHLHLLETRYGAPDPAYLDVEDAKGRTSLDQAVEHATNIYRSMDFVLRDEMRVQGPASRIFSARVAYDILKFDGPRSARNLTGIRCIMDRFEQLGFKIPSLPDDRPFWSIVTGKT